MKPQLRFKGSAGEHSDWHSSLLGDVAEFRNGKGHEQLINKDGGYIVINSKFIASEGKNFKKSIKQLEPIKDDSVVMVMSDVPNGLALAKCFYIPSSKSFTLNQRICALHSKTVSNQYLFYFLNRNKYFLKFDSGVGQTNLKRGDVLNCPVIYPVDNQEQKKIASFLSSVDKKISLLSQKHELLNTYKRGVMRKIFNQDIRFKNSAGNTYPEWEFKSIGAIAKCYSGGTPSTTNKRYYDGEIPFIKSGEINLPLTSQKITEEGLTNSSAKLVNSGDLLFALYGATSGEVAISKINGAINQAVLCIRSTLNNYFLCSYLRFMKPHIVNKYIQGGQGNLSAEIIKNIEVPCPAPEEQEKIAQLLSNLDTKIQCAKRQLELTRQYKQGLLQQMFI